VIENIVKQILGIDSGRSSAWWAKYTAAFHSAKQSKATAKESNAMPNEAKQSNAKQSNAKQIKAMQSNAKQSKAKQSKANQTNSKQNKAKQHYPSVTVTRSRGGYYYCCPRGSCILLV
jgi:ATPase subunit of ABC transporter with duplicated ATPase domains